MCWPAGCSAKGGSTRTRPDPGGAETDAMQLTELLRAIGVVAETGGDPARCEALAREAENLADMVGWADGPIDPGGQWLERLAMLQDDLQRRHAQSGNTVLIVLHDALTRLGRAIARHDDDLDARNADGDDGGDFS